MPRERTKGVSPNGRVYSNKPQAVRNRIRKDTTRLADDIETLYQKPISEWDFQELQCGRPRDENGQISRKGKKPKWITPAMAAEAMKRLSANTAEEIGKYSGAALETMIDLMQNSRMDLVRFQAAQYLLDQIVGKPTQRQEITADVNVHSFLADVMRNPDGQEHRVIEGTVIEYDEEGDEDDE